MALKSKRDYTNRPTKMLLDVTPRGRRLGDAVVYRDTVYRDTVYRDTVYRDTVYRGTVYRGTGCCAKWSHRVLHIPALSEKRFPSALSQKGANVARSIYTILELGK